MLKLLNNGSIISLDFLLGPTPIKKATGQNRMAVSNHLQVKNIM